MEQEEWFEHHPHSKMVFLPAYAGDGKYMFATLITK